MRLIENVSRKGSKLLRGHNRHAEQAGRQARLFSKPIIGIYIYIALTAKGKRGGGDYCIYDDHVDR